MGLRRLASVHGALSDEIPPAGESTDAFDAVQIVEVIRAAQRVGSRSARSRIRVDPEVLAEPLEAQFHAPGGVVLVSGAAAFDLPAAHGGVAGVELPRGDDQRRDSGGGHAAGRRLVGGVAPGTVGTLRSAPVVDRRAPHLVVDLGSRAFGFVECEERELGVGVVAGSLAPRVGP